MHDTVYTEVDQMPMFNGCERVKKPEDRQECARQRMYEFIYRAVRYPLAARKAGVEGNVMIRFIVERDGLVTHVELVESVFDALDEETLRVVWLMKNDIKWHPGLLNGGPVRVNYYLPVRYRLER